MENNRLKVVESFHCINEIMYIISSVGITFETIGGDGDLLVYAESDQLVGAEIVEVHPRPDLSWAGKVACHHGEIVL